MSPLGVTSWLMGVLGTQTNSIVLHSFSLHSAVKLELCGLRHTGLHLKALNFLIDGLFVEDAFSEVLRVPES